MHKITLSCNNSVRLTVDRFCDVVVILAKADELVFFF
jgi:hypothetical protein